MYTLISLMVAKWWSSAHSRNNPSSFRPLFTVFAAAAERFNLPPFKSYDQTAVNTLRQTDIPGHKRADPGGLEGPIWGGNTQLRWHIQGGREIDARRNLRPWLHWILEASIVSVPCVATPLTIKTISLTASTVKLPGDFPFVCHSHFYVALLSFLLLAFGIWHFCSFQLAGFKFLPPLFLGATWIVIS